MGREETRREQQNPKNAADELGGKQHSHADHHADDRPDEDTRLPELMNHRPSLRRAPRSGEIKEENSAGDALAEAKVSGQTVANIVIQRHEGTHEKESKGEQRTQARVFHVLGDSAELGTKRQALGLETLLIRKRP